MRNQEKCSACGACLDVDQSCETNFHQMLFWETENPAIYGAVHHYTVLCYHLQHPHIYSMQGLNFAKNLLRHFLDEELDPAEARKRMQKGMQGTQRDWKITATEDSIGAYANPIIWTMTTHDIITIGANNYVESVLEWARSILDDLSTTDNL